MLAPPVVPALAQVVTYEGTSFPETRGWERDTYCTPERWLDNGWLYQFLEEDATACGKGDAGDRDRYFRDLEGFVGIDRFFVEWRMEATGDRSEVNLTAPASMVASSFGGTKYHFTMSRDLVRIIRDNLLPIFYIDIAPGVDHTYRIDLTNDLPDPWYAVYIDSELIDEGVAEGVYPFFTPVLSWRGRVWFFDSLNRWDFVRYGRTPDDASADFDSNGEVDDFEVFYIDECIQRSADGEPAFPSCSWSDVNADGTVDCDDWGIISDTMWTGAGPPPELPTCVVAPIPAVSDWGVGILALLMVTAATVAYGRPGGRRCSVVRAD